MSDIIKSNDNNQLSNNASNFEVPSGYICTLDITNVEGKIKLANALNGAVSMRDMIGEPLRVVDIVTTPGTRSRTGEVCTNSYLLCEDGTVYFTQSDGIARALKILVGIFTDQNTLEFTSPVSLGIALIVKEVQLQNGNTLKTVVTDSLD